MLAMDFIPFPSERQFVEYVCANYLALFPKLLEQSQFNRRARAIAPLLEGFRQHWLLRLLASQCLPTHQQSSLDLQTQEQNPTTIQSI